MYGDSVQITECFTVSHLQKEVVIGLDVACSHMYVMNLASLLISESHQPAVLNYHGRVRASPHYFRSAQQTCTIVVRSINSRRVNLYVTS